VSTDLQQFGRTIWIDDLQRELGSNININNATNNNINKHKDNSTGSPIIYNPPNFNNNSPNFNNNSPNFTNNSPNFTNNSPNFNNNNSPNFTNNSPNINNSLNINNTPNNNNNNLPVNNNELDVFINNELHSIRLSASVVLLDTVSRLDTFLQTAVKSSNNPDFLLDFTEKVIRVVQEQKKLEEHLPISGYVHEANESYTHTDERWIKIFNYISMVKEKLRAMDTSLTVYYDQEKLISASQAIVVFKQFLKTIM